MELWMIIVLVVAAVLFAGVAWQLTRRKKLPETITEGPAPKPPLEKAEPAPVSPVSVPAPPLKLSDKLARTRGALFGKLGKLLGGSSGSTMQVQEWQAVEEALLEADVGISTTTKLITRVKEKIKAGDTATIRDLMRQECRNLLPVGVSGLPDLIEKPFVVSIVGVNGVGKTTTTGKLAHLLQRQGKNVLLCAADTFRAAAIAQLQIWADRAGVQMVTGREGADPGAVAFDSLTAAKARDIDVVLVDTAGRLHNKSSLMDELKKVHRVMKKVVPSAPHETWLVLDGTFGQNSLAQAKEFQKTLELTGVIITKLDGTAKGGAILAVSSELNLPVRFIGVGEAIEDFIPFDPGNFVDAILGDA